MRRMPFVAMFLFLTSVSFAQTVGDKVITINKAVLRPEEEVRNGVEVRTLGNGQVLVIEQDNGESFL